MLERTDLPKARAESLGMDYMNVGNNILGHRTGRVAQIEFREGWKRLELLNYRKAKNCVY